MVGRGRSDRCRPWRARGRRSRVPAGPWPAEVSDHRLDVGQVRSTGPAPPNSSESRGGQRLDGFLTGVPRRDLRVPPLLARRSVSHDSGSRPATRRELGGRTRPPRGPRGATPSRKNPSLAPRSRRGTGRVPRAGRRSLVPGSQLSLLVQRTSSSERCAVRRLAVVLVRGAMADVGPDCGGRAVVGQGGCRWHLCLYLSQRGPCRHRPAGRASRRPVQSAEDVLGERPRRRAGSGGRRECDELPSLKVPGQRAGLGGHPLLQVAVRARST